LIKIYSSLALRESKSIEIPSLHKATENKCVDLALTITKLANSITEYIIAVGEAYNGNSEQTSVFILNIFDLWVAMDKCATVAYPLLSDYHPWFTPEILDVLLLPQWEQLKRLQTI
jgi:hypothetical protein